MGPFFESPLEPKLKGLFICGSGGSTDNPAVSTLPASVCAPRGINRRCAAAAWLLCASLALGPAWGHGSGGGSSGGSGSGGGGGRSGSNSGSSNSSGRSGGDHERARDAVRSGAVLPLATLVEQLRLSHPGQVLEVEIDSEDGRVIYEVKLLHANGQLLKLEIDAATGQVLKVRQKDK